MGQTEPFFIVQALSPSEKASYFAIRDEVFCGEQQVPPTRERDADDAKALHFLALKYGETVGTARVVLKDNGMTAKIGRLAVRKPSRGAGLGAAIMAAVEQAEELAGVTGFALEAQTHAIPFYEKLGYIAEGPEYRDAGIPHRLMRKNKTSIRQPNAARAAQTEMQTSGV